MEYKTYGEIKTEVLMETDTEAEDFLQTDEIKGYAQDAINECEAHIHKLGLDDYYFTTRTKYSLTNGQETLAMPTNIYANKIRALMYSTSSKVYPIKRLKGKNKYEVIEHILQSPSSGMYYQYDILNDNADDGPVIALYPFSYETLTDCITMTYIRNMTDIVDEDTKIEVPEFYSFIKAYMRYKIFKKEGSQMIPEALADLEKERNLMIQTLEEMVPDEDSEIPGDLTHYEEMA